MIELDGSRGEGGGQVLRTALTLSACLRLPSHMIHNRARPRQPGLKAQHLAATRAVASLCGAKLSGDEVGSRELRFQPGPLRSGTYAHDVGTAGATSLVAQAALLPLLRAPGPSRLAVSGGTHVAWAPPFDYLRDIYVPFLRLLGHDVSVELERYGFYPRGGGRIAIGTPGDSREQDRCLLFERPARRHVRVDVTAVVCSLPRHIAERMTKVVRVALSAKHWSVRERIVELEGPTGTYVYIRVHTRREPTSAGGSWIAGGFTGLGALRKPAEEVGAEAAREALAFLGTDACFDPHLADQVLLPAVLSGTDLTFTTSCVSHHLETQAETLAQFVGPCVEIGPRGRIRVRHDA